MPLLNSIYKEAIIARGTEDAYKRLGSCLALAARGSTQGERAAGIEAAKRVIAALPGEQRAAMAYVLGQLAPSADGQSKRPPIRRKTGTKRAKIIELLDQGRSVHYIATALGIKKNYVYHVKAERKYYE